MASFLFIINHSGFIQLLATLDLFKNSIGEKEIQMFYLASVIKLNIFLELLWNPTLNSYVTSQKCSGLHILNQFDIFTVVWRLLQVLTIG